MGGLERGGLWLAAILFFACPAAGPPRLSSEAVPVASRFEWQLPAGFPEPRVPADNPMTDAKVKLGRHLFYDRRLSGNGSLSCAGCHRPELAFTDGRARAVGSTGELHPRSTMSLANVAYNRTLTWADPYLRRLEEQLRLPMFNEQPVELGLRGREAEVLARLRREPRYRELFAEAYPEAADAIRMEQISQAIASFERTLISGNSAYDRWVYWGEGEGFSEAARRGMRLFFSERLGCSECHAGFTFSGPVEYRGGPEAEPLFHNTGLYNLEGRGFYPLDDQGLLEHTGQSKDMGRFRASTLRNIEVTAPYMHDGSIATLEAVIQHYAAGGRASRAGSRTAVGRENPYKSPRVRGFSIDEEERRQLVAFLKSLTDRAFLSQPRFSDPWVDPPEEVGGRRGAAASPSR
ncbi:MAG: MbnH family di-heme enzyme [Thermoanaerobaculia bacterium]